MRRVCAWCGQDLGTGRESAPVAVGDTPRSSAAEAPVTHGICVRCMANLGTEVEVETLWGMGEAEADRLPLGRMILSRDGIVRRYNAAEEAISGRHRSEVVGRHFFRDVAPCTRVREFEGRFNAMVEAGRVAIERFDFRFRFEGDTALLRDAQVVFVHDPPVGMLVLVMVKD